MVNRIMLFVLFLIGCLLYSQDLIRNPMNPGQFDQLSDAEKIEHIKMWFQEGIYNVPWNFAQEFVRAGGRDIIPFLLEELPKHEFYYDIYDERLDFIFNALAYFRDRNLLTLYESLYIAGILEGKLTNYVKRYGQRYGQDLYVTLYVDGINANIWMFLAPYQGSDSYITPSERNEIIRAKYRAMGLDLY